MKLAASLAALVLGAGAPGPASAAPLKPTPPAKAAGDAPLPQSGATAIARRFGTLDAYLAYLQSQSHLDRAWYREVRPGLYELQPGNLRRPGDDQRRRRFTREELEKKFGFAK